MRPASRPVRHSPVPDPGSLVTLSFGVTFDYLCPWARNVNEHVAAGLRGGADWQVRFVPYSLRQGKVAEGETAVWDLDQPDETPGVLALKVGLTVRDQHPDQFLDVHPDLFAVRHEHGLDNRDPEVLADVLTRHGVDAGEVMDVARDPSTTERLRAEHERAVEDHHVWGVPTLIGRDRSVFVRVLDRPEDDAQRARERIEQLMALVDGAVELHEFKTTVLDR